MRQSVAICDQILFPCRQYRRQNKSGAHWEGLSREEGSLAGTLGSLFRRRQPPPDIAEMSMFNNGLSQIISAERSDEGMRNPIVPPTLGLS